MVLTFALLLTPSEVEFSRFQSKANIAETVITAKCVLALCILPTNIYLLTLINIYVSRMKTLKKKVRQETINMLLGFTLA